MSRSNTTSRAGDTPAGIPTDAIVGLLREHTEIEVLAGRMHEVADAAERGDAGASAELREGLQVHRHFVVGVHERKEGLLGEALGTELDAASQTSLEACTHEHARSVRFEQEAERRLSEGRLSPTTLKAVATLFHAEAERLVEHHRAENEVFYRPLRTGVSAAGRGRLRSAFAPFDGETAAAQGRLTAWTSRGHASAD